MPFENAVNRVKFYQTWSAVIEKFHSEDTIDKEAIDRLNVIKKESKGRWINILRAREI
jgi:hypothetical protein